MDNKDLLRQYVDSGLVISDYQIKQLSGSLLNTYLRKRLIALENGDIHSTEYEYSLFDDDGKRNFIKSIVKRHSYLPPAYLELSSDDIKSFYVDTLIADKDSLDSKNYSLLPDELKLKYIKYRVEGYWDFKDSFIDGASPEFTRKALEVLAMYTNKLLSDEKYKALPDDLKMVYLKHHSNAHETEKQYRDRTPELKYLYITAFKNRELTPEQLFRTPNDLAMIYLKQRLAQGWPLNYNELSRYDILTNGQ
jgi:hypothetical protein